jgi:hypothetical protein
MILYILSFLLISFSKSTPLISGVVEPSQNPIKIYLNPSNYESEPDE